MYTREERKGEGWRTWSMSAICASSICSPSADNGALTPEERAQCQIPSARFHVSAKTTFVGKEVGAVRTLDHMCVPH
jgi:hypothetical protein